MDNTIIITILSLLNNKYRNESIKLYIYNN